MRSSSQMSLLPAPVAIEWIQRSFAEKFGQNTLTFAVNELAGP